jgi:hypothetical protein
MTPEEIKRYSAILEIWILISIAFYFIQKKLVENYIEAAKENINETRRNPIFVFFGGFMGMSGLTSFNSMIGEKITSIFKEYLSFLNPIFEMFSGVFKKFQDSINGIRNILAPMRNFFKASASMFYNQIQNFTIGILYALHKIRDTMKRTLSGFNLLYHTLEHSKNSIQSIVNSPPVDFAFSAIGKVDWLYGKARRFNFCFHEDTPIKLKDGSVKNIKDISIGDELEYNNIVIGKQIFLNNQRMYLYNDIIVSGSHLVNENGKWIRVDESFNASLTNIIPEKVYSLTTLNKTIHIYNTIFKDYSESDNKYINMNINKIILEHLNNNNVRNFNPYPSKLIEHGFGNNSILCMSNGLIKSIKDVKLYDKIEGIGYQNEVIGIIELDPKYFDIYCNNGIYVSSNIKVLENNIWINVENSKFYKKVNNSDKPNQIINLVTLDSTISLLSNNGHPILFRDYLETHDLTVIKNIEELVKKFL